MKFFNNISIGTKFLCSSLLIAGIFTLISWRSISAIEHCHISCHKLINGAFATKSLTQEAQTSFYALAETANQSLVSTYLSGFPQGNNERTRRFNAQAAELAGLLDKVVQALEADPFIDASIIKKLVAQLIDAQTILNTSYVPLVYTLIDAQEYADNPAQLSADFLRSETLSAKIASDIDEVCRAITEQGESIFDNYVVFLLATIRNLKIYDAVAVACSLLLMIFITLALKKPFALMMNTLKEIAAAWDLTKHVAVQGKDEVGSLAAFINLTFEKMRGLLAVIKGITLSLSSTGADLALHTSQTASSINEITAAIKNMKSQMDTQSDEVHKTNGAMENILSHVDRLNKHIDVQSESVSQSSSSMEQMFANIHSVVETLSKNAINVVNLAEASEVGKRGLEKVAADIQEVARESEGLLAINAVIQDIASRTNLLSMNAAIEAAHAGEAGRGFAVVAGEIRKLSESSERQSLTINAVLQKIKKSIDMITKSTAVLVKGFETIDAGVTTVSIQESAVHSAMEEQEAGSRTIFEEITKLKTITDLVKTSSADIASQGEQVKRQSATLEQITGEINSGMDDISKGAELIIVSANQVNDISDANRQSISTLNKEMSKFKV
ncbi:MAG: methyl-accepting chemotaxis protein [Spirochaetaceae bacterium]|jgi:methyl-accepting chemotaxis protein|nr:methyl-accepting chemotaxis protein [Spirochaetaceae bacterium]